MKDLPMFTTENGAAGLVLQEIPYSKTAYVTIHSAVVVEDLLEDCVSFCRAVGAEHIYACVDGLEAYPVYTEVWEMSTSQALSFSTNAQLRPVTAETLHFFLEIYRQKMAHVPAASYLTERKAKSLLDAGSLYFAYMNDVLIGIGVIGENRIQAVASLIPGGGRESVIALCQHLSSDRILLEVASQNHKAVALYESLGFTKEKVLKTWHKIK